MNIATKEEAIFWIIFLCFIVLVWSLQNYLDDRRDRNENKKLFLSEEEKTEQINKLLKP